VRAISASRRQTDERECAAVWPSGPRRSGVGWVPGPTPAANQTHHPRAVSPTFENHQLRRKRTESSSAAGLSWSDTRCSSRIAPLPVQPAKLAGPVAKIHYHDPLRLCLRLIDSSMASLLAPPARFNPCLQAILCTAQQEVGLLIPSLQHRPAAIPQASAVEIRHRLDPDRSPAHGLCV